MKNVFSLHRSRGHFTIVWFLILAAAVFTTKAQERPLAKTATLVIDTPTSGETLFAPASIKIQVTAIDPDADIRKVTFYANEQQIGVSEHITKDAVIPGRPRFHFHEWSPVEIGEYKLSARAVASNGKEIVAPTVWIRVVERQTINHVLPIVSIDAKKPETSEPAPEIRVIPGVFAVRRVGHPDRAITVHVVASGTAQPGEDYEPLPRAVVMEPGVTEVELTVKAFEDDLIEGDEVVTLEVANLPFDVMPQYQIDTERSGAKITIHDSTRLRGASIQITSPRQGQIFPPGSPINIEAVAVDPDGFIAKVEFLNRDQVIGTSELAFFVEPPAGSRILHSLEWRGPESADAELSVRALDTKGNPVQSKPVFVYFGNDSTVPYVSVHHIEPVTDGAIDADYAPGLVEISRRGGSDEPLEVFFEASGTARAGADYLPLPKSVIIPKGESSVQFKVEAIDDKEAEGRELVLIALTPPPFAELTTRSVFTPSYLIDEAQGRAAVAILDNDQSISHATITITAPTDGARFPAGGDITFRAVAVDPAGYLPRVEFYAGDKLLGVSEIFFIRAPDPGTPIEHEFVWTNASPGKYQVTARAVDAAGNVVQSRPVAIVIGEGAGQVAISIEVLDRTASESGPNGSPDPAVFVIKRAWGPKDVAVSITYSVDGSAVNGTDFARLSGEIVLPAGKDEVELAIDPVPDKALEPSEYVVITLLPRPCIMIFPPPPDCYLIAGAGSARALIRDSSAGDMALEVFIREPQNGSVLMLGEKIKILAHVSADATAIEKLDILVNGTVVGTAKQPYHALEWSPAERGSYQLQARVLTTNGGEAVSEPVTVGARVADPKAFVNRELPPVYLPGEALTVKLAARPDAGTKSYSAEDGPPHGWAVSEISHGGKLDATGYVTFGPFADGEARVLTYVLTPPTDASKRVEFEGISVVDDSNRPIGGARGLMPARKPEEGAPPPRIVASEKAGNAVGRLQFSNVRGQICVLEASEDLKNWKEVQTIWVENGEIAIPNASDKPSKQVFYRLRLP